MSVDLVTRITEDIRELKNEQAKLLAQVETLTGEVGALRTVVFGNALIEQKSLPAQLRELQANVQKLSERNSSIADQIKGARWAFIALALITGLPQLSNIAHLLGLLP